MSRCSFCGQAADEVAYLVAGPRGVAICDECAALAHQVASEALRPVSEDLLLTGISRLVTQDERRGPEGGEIHRAAVAVRRGRLTWVGPETDLPSRYRQLPLLDCGGRVVCPGMVDASNRMLVDPAPGTRLDPDAVAADLSAHLQSALARGVTSVDLRAGGTADPSTDTTLLAVARAVAERSPVGISVTWEVGSIPARFLPEPMGPTAARLASSALVRCDGTGAGARLAERIAAHLPVRMATCRSGSDGCVSTPVVGIEGPGAVVEAPRVPVLEADGVLRGEPFPAAQRWRETGGCALATGSGRERRLVGMGPVAALGVALGGLTPWQAMWSIARGGALAIGDPERGRLRIGDAADLVVLDTTDPLDVVHRPDAELAWRVMVGGLMAVE